MQKARWSDRRSWHGMLLVLLMGALTGSAAAQAPTGTGGQRIGAQLIGKIEGQRYSPLPLCSPSIFTKRPCWRH